MKNAEFQPKLNPAPKPFKFPSKSGLAFLLKDCFKPQVAIAIGCFIQVVLCAILPFHWAVVPSAAVLLNSLITTLVQVVRIPKPNEFNEGIVPGRVTAQLPSPTGSFGNEPGANSVVVFHLGFQINHPLGLAAPGVDEMNVHFTAMQKELNRNRTDYGFLTSSTWRGDERSSNNSLLIIYYFRDVEGLHRFAHGDYHRKAWDFMTKTKPKHVGIFHETYSVPAHEYENIYVNCHPVMMGRASVKTTGGDEEKWTNTLVNADVPALKTQYARMSRDEQGIPKEL
ncbi:uncharacterized protein FIESC28_10156 [Fusarium coffeatum]|uniref:Uncharacterized protein n=1 Tax=Fusarium coffeatum TaxID=231269 RepID=A0A366QVE9_9HYPO|nr:uncharacterized protein FIESC28_10156 [Fusarium coffeatum]RBR08702.1 hypothetical protein FIESC28_10156 [Fusarium coffeatum]